MYKSVVYAENKTHLTQRKSRGRGGSPSSVISSVASQVCLTFCSQQEFSEVLKPRVNMSEW